MEPLKKEKRESAELVPYKKTEKGFVFYLQQRSKDAVRAPGGISVFGGGREGAETIEENLKREIFEELAYTAESPIYFSRYESGSGIFHIFIEEVDETFESKVIVQEGEYGLFLSCDEAQHHETVTPLTKLIVWGIDGFLKKNKK